MVTTSHYNTNDLFAQLCSDLTSVATNCDTESGGNYIGPLFEMATHKRHTTDLAAQLCSDLTSDAKNSDTETGVYYTGPFVLKGRPHAV
jgi:hypothetical protein